MSGDGGQIEVLTTPDTATGQANHLFPVVLPNGRDILFTIVAAGAGETRVAVLDLKSRQVTDLLPGAVTARYAAGRLICVNGSTLAASPFDLERLELVGEAVTLAEGVLMGVAGGAYVDVAAVGTVVYVSAALKAQAPRRLLSTSYHAAAIHPYDVSSDGQRFLMIKDLDLQRDSGGRIVVLLDALGPRR